MSILARLRGTVEEKTAESVVLFVGGLGFEVLVPRSTLANLPEVGEVATLRTVLYVREATVALYGFGSAAEQAMFELLLTVSGIGPKGALNCLSLLSVDQLSSAIGSGDGEILRRVPGIGRKTADRLLLELKERVGKIGGDAPAYAASTPGVGSQSSDIFQALLTFGYSAGEASAAIASLPREEVLSVDEQIMRALQYFAPKPDSRGRG